MSSHQAEIEVSGPRVYFWVTKHVEGRLNPNAVPTFVDHGRFALTSARIDRLTSHTERPSGIDASACFVWTRRTIDDLTTQEAATQLLAEFARMPDRDWLDGRLNVRIVKRRLNDRQITGATGVLRILAP